MHHHNRRTTRPRSAWAIALLATSIAPALAIAQDRGDSGRGGERAAGQPARAVDREEAQLLSTYGPVVSLNFAEGGTVLEYVEALRKAAGAPANIAVSTLAASGRVPPVRLENARLYAALRLLNHVASPPSGWKLDVQVLSFGETATFAIGTTAAPLWPEGQPATANPNQIAVAQLEPSLPQVEVYSLRELVGGGEGDASLQVALTAIEAALALQGATGGDAPELRYHEDSCLLIVRGKRREQLAVVESVIDRLMRDARTRRSDRQRLQAELAASRALARDAQANAAKASVVLADVDQRFTELRKLHQNGAVSDADLREAEGARQLQALEYERAVERQREAQERLADTERRFQRHEEDAAQATMGQPAGLRERAKSLESRIQALQAELAEVRRQLSDAERGEGRR